MYIAQIFNTTNKFQNLGGFIKGKKIGDSPNRDEFFLHATNVLVSLNRLKMLNTICLDQIQKYKDKLTIVDDEITYWSPTLVEMLTIIPSVFSSLIIMQDKFMPMLNHIGSWGKTFPSSFNDVIKKIDSYGLSPAIVILLKGYWDSNGDMVRDYRDLGQHFYYLTLVTYYRHLPSESIVVALPDNPGVKNKDEFKYRNKVNAIDYLLKSFDSLHDCIENIVKTFGCPPGNIEQSIAFGHMPKVIIPGIKKTLIIMVHDSKGEYALEVGQTSESKIYLEKLGKPY